ncbi:hypothetical protein [Streptomyces sp. NPDC048392]|uniref:hypothetical protein n=1 Tax=Streptomyces sp. NPDC048392 TaxID=3365543 RepID=UPI00371FC19D
MTCPGCWHPVTGHAIQGGHAVCTRGVGRVSCRECAHAMANLSLERYGKNVAEGIAAGLRRGQGLRVPRSYALARPVVAGWSPAGGTVGPSTA